MMNTSLGRTFMGGFEFLALVYHSIVWDVRKGKNNALHALAMEVFQAVIVVVFFYAMISIMGFKTLAIRGSFVLYVMSGVFLFMTHNKAIGAVASGSVSSPMLNHAPVSTLLMMVSGAFSALYIQIFAVIVVTFAANVIIDPFTVQDWKALSFAFIMAWFSGVAIGILFLSLTPFFPAPMKLIKTIYTRANMLFSGKMMPANTVPAMILPMFTWNPLFHAIIWMYSAENAPDTIIKSVDTGAWFSIGLDTLPDATAPIALLWVINRNSPDIT